MKMRLGSLYDALKSAKVDEDLACRAAEEVASLDTRLDRAQSSVRTIKYMLYVVVVTVTFSYFTVFVFISI